MKIEGTKALKVSYLFNAKNEVKNTAMTTSWLKGTMDWA